MIKSCHFLHLTEFRPKIGKYGNCCVKLIHMDPLYRLEVNCMDQLETDL